MILKRTNIFTRPRGICQKSSIKARQRSRKRPAFRGRVTADTTCAAAICTRRAHRAGVATVDPAYKNQISQDTRVVACPLHATFDGGMAYTLNSQLVENNTHPHQSAMIALHTRTDAFDVQTTGSGSLMSLEKTTN